MSQLLIRNSTINVLKYSSNFKSTNRICSSSISYFLNQNEAKHIKCSQLIKNDKKILIESNKNNFLCLGSISYGFSSIRYFHNTRFMLEKDDSGKKDDDKNDNSNSSGSDGGDDGNHNNKLNDEPNPLNDGTGSALPLPSLVALAPIQIPDSFPKVPIVAISRNPLFPNFIKMLEITDKNLVELIRRKVYLNVPYIGVFMRKDDKYDLFYFY
jgi:hypothetical protein